MSDKEKQKRLDSLAESMSALYGFGINEKITVVDIIILSIIHRNPGITMTETAKMALLADVPFTTVHYSFVSFSRMKLISKKRHPRDYKSKQVFLTQKGEKLVEAMVSGF